MKQRNKNKKFISPTAILCLVLVLATIGTVVYVFMNKQLFRKSDIDAIENPGQYENVIKSPSGDVKYFLLAGLHEDENLTDIIMLVCFDLKEKKANVMQIPRDTYIGKQHAGGGKINAVFNHPRENESKIKALARYVNSHMGLPVDHYFTFTMPGFIKIIDTVGGVEIDIPQKVRHYDDYNHEWRTIPAGLNVLDGAAALGFIRHRDLPLGDISRMESQRVFYSAFIKKMINLSITQVLDLTRKCSSEISSDLTPAEILGFVQEAKKIEAADIMFYGVPGQAEDHVIPGVSFYSIHKKEYLAIINENFFPYGYADKTEEDLKITELHKVYRGSWMTGAYTIEN